MEVRDLFVSDAAYSGTAQTARVLFGPDGKVYMVIGVPLRNAVGKAESAQDPADHAGKVLRLNEDGTVPDDNPFVDTPGHRPEIYAFGIRNSNGLAFHPETGELWETENGPQGRRRGQHHPRRPQLRLARRLVRTGLFGRSDRHGLRPQRPQVWAEGIEDPFFFWSPSISPAGMLFYTGDPFPNWTGDLFVGGLRSRDIQRLIFNDRGLAGPPAVAAARAEAAHPRGEAGADGLIYVLTDEDDGALLRIEPEEAQ